MPEAAAVFRRPFDEQVAFFRGKLGNLVPTAKWDDIQKSAHDRAFMVAGAQKADLLSDLAAAVDKAIADGETLDAFRARFLEIVRRHGWAGWTGDDRKTPDDKGGAGVAWRTRVIYQTNLATSYAAGRLAQLKEAGYRYWVYKHSDSVAHPRPQHLAWNGLTLPADHPFWQTHYPPSGWGCRCRVVGANGAEGAKLLGGNPDYNAPPEGWDAIDPKTGEPVGIDNGWGYMPGGTVADTVRALKDKLDRLPPEPSIAAIQDWLKSETFARWFASPQGSFPLARIPDADAQALGAKDGVRVASLSAESAIKQAQAHPELTADEYAAAQSVVDGATQKAFDGKSAIYIRELPDGGHVLVVKVTQTGEGMWVTSYRRLSSKEAARDSEIRRLLKKGNG